MTQRTVRIELKIKSATVENVDDKLTVIANWQRGNTNIQIFNFFGLNARLKREKEN